MKKLINEFKIFITRGNVIDLAVAVIIGAAFSAIINSVVNDLVTPLISLLTFGVDFSTLSFSLGEGANAAVFSYGSLIQAIINFLITALVIFLIIKAFNKFSQKKPQEDERSCPYCSSVISETAVRCPSCTTILDASKVPDDIR